MSCHRLCGGEKRKDVIERKKAYLDLGLPGPSCSLLSGEVVGESLDLLHFDIRCRAKDGRIVLLLLLVLEGGMRLVVKEAGSSGLMVLM